MADALRPWHERIAAEVKDSACLHADETGWRVDGFRWFRHGGCFANADASRLGSRISRHRDHLFTFLDKPLVPFENNHAERQIRPAVIMRMKILFNRSTDGADTQAVLISAYRTLRLRGHDTTNTSAAAWRQWLKTGNLLALPAKIVAGG